MDSLLAQDESLYPSWRHPSGTKRYFDSDAARGWIEDYNRTGNAQSLNDLLEHIEPLARSILEYRSTTEHESIDELLSRIRIKVWQSIRLFDPARGSAFSFCAMIVSRAAMSAVAQSWNWSERFCALGEATEPKSS